MTVLPVIIEVSSVALELACQSASLLLLLPLMLWLGEDVPALLAGRAVAPLWERYRRLWAFWRSALGEGLPVGEGVMLSLVLLVLFSAAGLSFFMPVVLEIVGARLADPLLLGCILLVGSLWAVPGCAKRGQGGGGWVAHGRCALVLCLTESFLVLAAPGVTGLLGVHRLLLASPGSGLAGTGLCCALALALSTPLPDRESLAEAMMARHYPASRAGRDRVQVILGLYHAAWALLLGDVLVPVLFGLAGPGGVAGLVLRYGGGVVLLVLCRATGMSQDGRPVALLLGLAGLLALAGRFAI